MIPRKVRQHPDAHLKNRIAFMGLQFMKNPVLSKFNPGPFFCASVYTTYNRLKVIILLILKLFSTWNDAIAAFLYNIINMMVPF